MNECFMLNLAVKILVGFLALIWLYYVFSNFKVRPKASMFNLRLGELNVQSKVVV